MTGVLARHVPSTSYSYDSLSRLLSVLHQASGTTIDGASYTYDNAGNRTSKTNDLNGITENYTYDALYELTQVTQGGSTTESYSYDLVGNRLSSLGVPTYNYNSSNELTSSSQGSYAYDANGSTLSDPTGKTYTWDFENRLTSVTVPGSGTTTFAYDPFGRRIQKAGPLGTTSYLYDDDNVIGDINPSGACVAHYLQGEDTDEPLALSTSAGLSWYEDDALGSITSLSGSSGLTDTYTYTAFGSTTATGTSSNRFRFTGREWDQETNLYYYRARYMDANTGRFLSEDPIDFEGGMDFYAYVANNPGNYFDPDGMQQQNDNTATYGEIGSWAVNHVGPPQDLSAPGGLADARPSIGASCSRNGCRHAQPGPGANPIDQAAWNNIVNANGGTDRSGGGNFMCVGGQGCWFVHRCMTCAHNRPRMVPRPTPLLPSGTVTVQGKGTLYFYNDPLQGWDTAANYNSRCRVRVRQRHRRHR